MRRRWRGEAEAAFSREEQALAEGLGGLDPTIADAVA
jgi:hypothetical protein